MKRLRLTLAALGAGFTLYLAPVHPTLAAHVAYDSQSLEGQSAATQRIFQSTWGEDAAMRWAMEHNMELVAQGIAPASTLDTYGGAQVQSSMEQSGAQTVPDEMSRNSGLGRDDEANPPRNDGDDDEDDDASTR